MKLTGASYNCAIILTTFRRNNFYATKALLLQAAQRSINVAKTESAVKSGSVSLTMMHSTLKQL